MWGLCTKTKITRNSIVIDYVGEVICDKEGDERGTKYDKNKLSYLLDLPSFSKKKIEAFNEMVDGKMLVKNTFSFPLVFITK